MPVGNFGGGQRYSGQQPPPPTLFLLQSNHQHRPAPLLIYLKDFCDKLFWKTFFWNIPILMFPPDSAQFWFISKYCNHCLIPKKRGKHRTSIPWSQLNIDMRSRRIIIGAASSVSACWGLEGPCRPITKYRTHAGRAISGKGESQRYILRRFLCLKPPCYQSLSSSNIFTLFIRQHQTEVKRCITLTGQFWLEWVGRNKIQLNSRAAEGRQRLAAPWIIVLTNWLVAEWGALGTHVPSGYCPSAHYPVGTGQVPTSLFGQRGHKWVMGLPSQPINGKCLNCSGLIILLSRGLPIIDIIQFQGENYLCRSWLRVIQSNPRKFLIYEYLCKFWQLSCNILLDILRSWAFFIWKHHYLSMLKSKVN